jgi:hypothetical protein
VAAWVAWITEKHLKTTGHREEGSGNCSGPSPGRAQGRLALAVVVAFFITAGPLSTIQLGRIDAFIPAYATAMFVNDSITRSCNEKRIADYPNLSNYMRELYQVPGSRCLRLPGQQERAMAEQVQWHLSGDYFENCNCSVVCPCLVSKAAPLTSRPTEGVCNVPLIFHIESGKYGGLALDGLNVALAIQTPGPMAEGNWSVAAYIDQTR